MEIILLQKVANLGNIGDRVKVKSGYGRNFLLPQGKATLATPDNIAKFEARRAELEKAAHEELSQAQARAAKLRRLQADADGQGRRRRQAVRLGRHLRHRRGAHQGRVTTIERSEVRLPHGPIRQAGEHVVQLHLHTDVTVDLPVVDRRRRVGRASAATRIDGRDRVEGLGRRVAPRARQGCGRRDPRAAALGRSRAGRARRPDARQPRLGHDRRPARRRAISIAAIIS